MVSNQDHFAAGVDVARSVAERAARSALYDPQTSGGLLVAVDGAQADALLDALGAAGLCDRDESG